MPPSKDQFVDYVLNLIQDFGPAMSRKTSDGHGIFLDGVMFAVIVDNVLFFKVDGATDADFKELELPPFVQNEKDEDVVMSYVQAPDSALKDRAEMTRWATLAHGVAVKAAIPKKPA